MTGPKNSGKDESVEQYIKDVRSVDTGKSETAKTKEDINEAEINDKAQEENKKSQMNAELESKFGDCSEPEKSNRKNKP